MECCLWVREPRSRLFGSKLTGSRFVERHVTFNCEIVNGTQDTVCFVTVQETDARSIADGYVINELDVETGSARELMGGDAGSGVRQWGLTMATTTGRRAIFAAHSEAQFMEVLAFVNEGVVPRRTPQGRPAPASKDSGNTKTREATDAEPAPGTAAWRRKQDRERAQYPESWAPYDPDPLDPLGRRRGFQDYGVSCVEFEVPLSC